MAKKFELNESKEIFRIKFYCCYYYCHRCFRNAFKSTKKQPFSKDFRHHHHHQWWKTIFFITQHTQTSGNWQVSLHHHRCCWLDWFQHFWNEKNFIRFEKQNKTNQIKSKKILYKYDKTKIEWCENHIYY